jgi:predicted transcriptional regulator
MRAGHVAWEFADLGPPASLSFVVRLKRWTCVQYAKGYTNSMSAKETVLQAIHRLPEDVDYRAIAEEIAFLAALEQGDQDIHSGRVVSNEDARKKLESWTSS